METLKKLTLKKNSPPDEYLTKKEKDFENTGIFSKEEMMLDQRRVGRAKLKHKEHTERSTFLEAMISKEMIDFGIFGDNACGGPGTEFDDFFNGSDLIIEFSTDGERPGTMLSIDVTTGANGDEAGKKKDHFINNNIKNGKLSKLKYFDPSSPENNHLKGAIDMIPKVIVGTDTEGVKNLAEIMHGIVFDENKKEFEKKLCEHHIQLEILEEAKDRLRLYIKEAEKVGYNENDEIVSKQKKVLKIIKKVFEEKKRSVVLPAGARNNPVFNRLAGAGLTGSVSLGHS